jgi:hypothetical protein
MAFPDQVDQDLTKPSRVSVDLVGDRRLVSQPEADPLGAGSYRHRPVDVVEQPVWREECRLHRELPGLDPREVEQVVDQLQQVSAIPTDRVDGFESARRGTREVAVFEEQLAEAEDRRHGRPDLVAHVREELALGAARALRVLLRLLEGTPRCLELLGPLSDPVVESGVEVGEFLCVDGEPDAVLVQGPPPGVDGARDDDPRGEEQDDQSEYRGDRQEVASSLSRPCEGDLLAEALAHPLHPLGVALLLGDVRRAREQLPRLVLPPRS